jgi:hypothetical protein
VGIIYPDYMCWVSRRWRRPRQRSKTQRPQNSQHKYRRNRLNEANIDAVRLEDPEPDGSIQVLQVSQNRQRDSRSGVGGPACSSRINKNVKIE